jgi:hypothetical protein
MGYFHYIPTGLSGCFILIFFLPQAHRQPPVFDVKSTHHSPWQPKTSLPILLLSKSHALSRKLNEGEHCVRRQILVFTGRNTQACALRKKL